MRKTDHQLQQGLYISEWRKADAKNPYSVENTGCELPGSQGHPGLRGEHADLLPDEAPLSHTIDLTAARGACDARCAPAPHRRTMDLSFFLISLLNGLSVGLLLFMLASGLTLIFSMMGVLNFAHASFYMVGAYVAYSITQVIGFWWALLLAPPIVGALGALFERYALRRVHKFGHVPELLITFGLSYILLEVVQLIWGRQAVNFLPPESLRGPLFTIVELARIAAPVMGREAGCVRRHSRRGVHHLPGLPRLWHGRGHPDAAGGVAAAHAHAHWPGDPGCTDPSRRGRIAGP